jgi:hypothetical protein
MNFFKFKKDKEKNNSNLTSYKKFKEDANIKRFEERLEKTQSWVENPSDLKEESVKLAKDVTISDLEREFGNLENLNISVEIAEDLRIADWDKTKKIRDYKVIVTFEHEKWIGDKSGTKIILVQKIPKIDNESFHKLYKEILNRANSLVPEAVHRVGCYCCHGPGPNLETKIEENDNEITLTVSVDFDFDASEHYE